MNIYIYMHIYIYIYMHIYIYIDAIYIYIHTYQYVVLSNKIKHKKLSETGLSISTEIDDARRQP